MRSTMSGDITVPEASEVRDYAIHDNKVRRRRRSAAWGIVRTLVAAALVNFLLPVVANAVPGDQAVVVKPGGEGVLQCQFTGQVAYPGDTVYCNLRIGNGSDVDGQFWVFSDESSLQVLDKQNNVVTDPALRERFLNSWFFHVYTRPVITRSVPFEYDVTYDSQWVEVCPARTLGSYDAGPNPSNQNYSKMCPLGVIRGITGPRRFTEFNEPAYERQYRFAMTERDDGLDQSVFKGWGIKFDLVVRAQLPNFETCPTPRVNGTCTTPVYQRP